VMNTLQYFKAAPFEDAATGRRAVPERTVRVPQISAHADVTQHKHDIVQLMVNSVNFLG
jgi:hypothetical protein